uniref:UDP-GlcNAc:betaGal beta-1,3-N-acetylglucosaminyltransferase 7 n=1 Tax=Seriola dumerili TaxID=41447 RepID=A0A3B4TR46_SERDU
YGYWGERKKTSPSKVEGPLPWETWDVTSSNCSAKPQLTSQDWFQSLEDNFKQFMLYRHCRILPNLSPPKIKSMPPSMTAGRSFRKTWGKEQVVDGKRIKTLFLLGKPSNQAERANHQELVETHFLKCSTLTVPNIFEFLDSSNHEKNLFVWGISVIIRLCTPYAVGGVFLMDGTLARRLHWVGRQFWSFTPFDDVFLGMCLEVLQVTPVKTQCPLRRLAW